MCCEPCLLLQMLHQHVYLSACPPDYLVEPVLHLQGLSIDCAR